MIEQAVVIRNGSHISILVPVILTRNELKAKNWRATRSALLGSIMDTYANTIDTITRNVKAKKNITKGVNG